MFEATHIAFADESKFNTGRYRSVSVVTLPLIHYQNLNKDLSQLLKESNVKDFKWKDLEGAKDRFAAIKLIDFAINYFKLNLMRVDILIWDIECSRHKIIGRDDIANLGRMYHHLFNNILSERWPSNAKWAIHPDQNSAINWVTLKIFLKNKEETVGIAKEFMSMKEIVQIIRKFEILDLQERKSHEEPFIQLADLFAGMAAYSRESFPSYKKWKEEKNPQQSLFPTKISTDIKLSPSDKERCYVMNYFNQKCKNSKLGVSLESYKGLKTLDPNNSINFWWYEAQHNSDKAPIRVKSA